VKNIFIFCSKFIHETIYQISPKALEFCRRCCEKNILVFFGTHYSYHFSDEFASCQCVLDRTDTAGWPICLPRRYCMCMPCLNRLHILYSAVTVHA